MELEESQVEADDCSGCVTQDPSEAVKRSAAMFILKTAEKHKLPLSAMSSLLVDVSSLIAVCSQEDIINPFLGLESTYMQTKYFRENLGLLVSVIKHTYLTCRRCIYSSIKCVI